MKRTHLAGFDAGELRPLSPAQLARREQIRRIMAAAREGARATGEILLACTIAAPVAFGYVIWLALA